MGLLDVFSDKNEKKAAQAQKKGLDAGRTAAFGQLDTGEADLRGQYGTADSFYAPLADTYGRGSSAYADALGLNGAEGTSAARDRFSTSPGYEFALNEALRGSERAASAGGMLNSGNTLIALQDRAQGIANQEYGGYLDRLAGYDPLAVNVAGARAGISTGLGDRLLGLSGDRAGIDWAAETGKGTADANYQISKDQSGANIFGAITGGLSLGAKLLGVGGFGLGGGGAGQALNAAGYNGLV